MTALPTALDRASPPACTQRLHRDVFINYQLHRCYGEGYARLEDLRAAAAKIRGFEDFVREMGAQAEQAEREGRLANAAFYARAAEFFTPPRAPARRAAYERFLQLFRRAFAAEGIESIEVPYGASALPVSILRSRAKSSRGAVLLFGGFDSLIEEFFVVWRALADAGFDVVAFDGPGQGGARCLFGQVFDHDWERPVTAILDHLGLERASLVGLSMGGYWALRAAAYEPRIVRVVAWPPVYDWLDPLPRPLRAAVRAMVRWPRFMRWSIRVRMRLAPILRHVVQQTLYLQGDSEDLADVPRWFLGMNAAHLSSARVRADVLLMVGENDRFQPPRLTAAQARALTGARSVTTRIFTAAEHADMHCQIGNLGLAAGVAADWLAAKTDADEAAR